MEDQSLSEVIPILIGPIVCDAAVQEPATGKWTLVGIFGNVNVGQFPTRRDVSLYMRFLDAEGRYQIEINFVNADTNERIARATGSLFSPNRLFPADNAVPFPLLLQQPGTYSFEVWANGNFLGSTPLTVTPRRVPGSGEG